MTMSKRDGSTRGRRTVKPLTRKQSAKKYYILTNTEETEKNYIDGLRAHIKDNQEFDVNIKTRGKKNIDLVNEALKFRSLDPEQREIWIVFDYDNRNDFDQIISDAARYGIHVAWSNPCIEIWFCAYFGAMPTYGSSGQCISAFEIQLSRRTKNIEYDKNDKDIYSILYKNGDEKKALEIAEKKMTENMRNGKIKPSEMNPGTTLNELVDEIRSQYKPHI
jgi:hypothetical protein